MDGSGNVQRFGQVSHVSTGSTDERVQDDTECRVC